MVCRISVVRRISQDIIGCVIYVDENVLMIQTIIICVVDKILTLRSEPSATTISRAQSAKSSKSKEKLPHRSVSVSSQHSTSTSSSEAAAIKESKEC